MRAYTSKPLNVGATGALIHQTKTKKNLQNWPKQSGLVNYEVLVPKTKRKDFVNLYPWALSTPHKKLTY